MMMMRTTIITFINTIGSIITILQLKCLRQLRTGDVHEGIYCFYCNSVQQTFNMITRALCRFPSLKIIRINFLNNPIKSTFSSFTNYHLNRLFTFTFGI